MKNILFVCLGNIARSTMAEAMFRQMVANNNLSHQITIDSAGTSDWEVGKHPHPGTQAELKKHHIPFDGIIARQITPSDFKWADYIITMDNQNVANLNRLAPDEESKHKIYMAYDILPDKQGTEIADPWYTQKFDVTFAELSETLPHWLTRIKNDLNA
ncbi:low molecular weight protein-tyrosine-phosphatase [Periweissella fabalis]|uniref:protein-tyrosine-phosphatase n=1 Tax=Periweissella fabalis TaxID=1070421 RepID=A0A7X6N5B0_9LACO|nr:low molecular weight protein-tyrosine-phosphatase [Periweissella fabalis]MCM0599703.1 low molecular weight phosphotyrosine protein phosphatase [Periweissella fabalis]NKZ24884.1 low molecular weight phosphotyrosine protein phosphatase [Periweissella fabalis]